MARLMLLAGMLVAAIGCGPKLKPAPPGSPFAGYSNPDSITVFSLKNEMHRSPPQRDENGFHGWPVLGKVEIADRSKLIHLLNELNAGFAKKGDQADCHYPHHGVRIVEGGDTREFTVCFMCGNLYDFKSSRFLAQSYVPMLDKVLEEAGVPLSVDYHRDKTK